MSPDDAQCQFSSYISHMLDTVGLQCASSGDITATSRENIQIRPFTVFLE